MYLFIGFCNPVHGSEASGEKAEFNYFSDFYGIFRKACSDL